MNEMIKDEIFQLMQQLSSISEQRRVMLDTLTSAVKESLSKHNTVNLLYVCTHNSRRSHFGQVAGALAAAYFGVDSVKCYSAGTEVTAMNHNAVKTLIDFGFSVSQSGDEKNQNYTFDAEGVLPINCFSKRFDDDSIPKDNVIAIMTCTDAEQNCPFIPGAVCRIALPYQDPKQSDGTGMEQQVYAERFRQILGEALYVFSGLNR
ncbi:MAG: protein-tyrosine-phosphatase [Bacteroidota bacterium]